MDTSDFDRAGYYSRLRSREDELAAAIHHHLRAQNVRYPGLALETWLREGRYGHRVQQVRQALEESEDIALASLTRALGGIGLDAIWPILRLLCHDIALYLGGAVLAGGLIGGTLGFLAAGFGALPGALAGSALGAQAGTCQKSAPFGGYPFQSLASSSTLRSASKPSKLTLPLGAARRRAEARDVAQEPAF